MKKIFHMITETAESMSKYLEVQFPTNSKTQTIPIRDVSLKYMTDVISSVAFGIKLNSFDPEKVQFFDKGRCKKTLEFMCVTASCTNLIVF